MALGFPHIKQHDQMDCGAASLKIVAKHHGRSHSLRKLRDYMHVDREGVSLLGISDAAEKIGMRTLGVKLTYDRLREDAVLPAIIHWEQYHFLVVYKVKKDKVWISDPATTKYTLTRKEFMKAWASDVDEDGNPVGIALLLEPTPDFFKYEEEEKSKLDWKYLTDYAFRYKQLIWQLVLGIVLTSVFNLILPFMLQAMVDKGVNYQDLSFIGLILIAQLVLFVSASTVEIIRSWILLFVGLRVNISLISDFLMKMIRLPISFFSTRMTGDLLQRIGDNKRVEHFLTTAPVYALFSVVSVIVFGFVLAYYNTTIFLVFLGGALLYIGWVVFFLRTRRRLDYLKFGKFSESQNRLIEIIQGMTEIKLHNAERQKRWEWERVQAGLFRLSKEVLSLDQIQRNGARFINELKNILITFIAAKAVVDGQMTLGMLLAIQYIIGQLNVPLEQFVQFVRDYQDATISLNRLKDVHMIEEEAPVDQITIVPDEEDLVLEDVTFRYGGPHSPTVLKDINLRIPYGKTTAIVGHSGSGKTTLMKLLLNFYAPTDGRVMLGDINLANLDDRIWRDKIGTVMQDGFIFSESIAHNIALGEEIVDRKRLLDASKAANIRSFIDSLPLGYNTVIGNNGSGLSQGQKQRVLIARAVYKNPEYLFFDEATNALDAYNEMIIMDQMEDFFKERTVLVIAHRLSTVKNADNIVVLDKGEIVEQGTHDELTAMRGAYYYLVKNQLELGA